MGETDARGPDAAALSVEQGPGLLWLRLRSQRPVVAAHLRHVRGRFAAAGWRIHEGPEPPASPGGALAVMDDPWVEPLPEVAGFLAAAQVPDGAWWRVPRVSGLGPPQGWPTPRGPYTALDYERQASVPRRPGRGVAAGADPWCGFSVAAAGAAGELLAAGWPPDPARVARVPEALVYRYNDPAAHERGELDPFIPEDAETLVDVGCGHGLLGARHRRPGRRVIGIEPDWDLARQASSRLDLVLPVGAEEGLSALRPGLDCLVFADVLEHLVDPAAALAKAAEVLAPHGRVVTSLPNSAWIPVLRALAAGRWDPTVAGVQARDHLAAMTPASFRRLAAECGLTVVRETPLVAPLPWRLRLWAWCLSRAAGGDVQDLLTTQWVAVLERRG